MYRSLSDRGSLTEYVYVLPILTADPRVFLNSASRSPHFYFPLLHLGHLTCLSSRRRRRTQLHSVWGPTSTALYSLRPPHRQVELRRCMRPRCSYLQTKSMWSSFQADRSPALLRRTQRTTPI